MVTDMVTDAPAQPDTSRGASGPARLHALDWLRALALLGVFVFHAVHPFDLIDWHVKNDQQSFAVTVLLLFLFPWGMGFFFLLAGAGSRFALRSRSARRYLGERWRRLGLPFLVGSALLGPVQGYVEAVHHGTWSGSPAAYVPVWFGELASSAWRLDPGISPRWFGHVGFHLWFLGFLLAFSVLGLPVFRFLERDGARRAISRLTGWAGRPGGSLLLAVPITLVHLSLRAAFPAEHDWSDFGYLLAFFVTGYVLVGEPRLLAAVRRDGRLALAVGVAGFALMLAAFASGAAERWITDPGYNLESSLVTILFSCYAWSWVVVALGFGLRARHFQSAPPGWVGTLGMPFYLLHQPVILVIALFVVQTGAGIPTKLAVVLVTSLLATVGLCGLLVRGRLAATLLGVKPRPGRRSGSAPQAATA
jgi:glucans biosynthesis protein C